MSLDVSQIRYIGCILRVLHIGYARARMGLRNCVRHKFRKIQNPTGGATGAQSELRLGVRFTRRLKGPTRAATGAPVEVRLEAHFTDFAESANW